MNDQQDRYTDELNELLEQVDALFPELRQKPEQPAPQPDFDPDDYTPEDARTDEPLLYQNYSNRYGADVRNFSNGYGAGVPGSSGAVDSDLPVFNGDYRRNAQPEQDWLEDEFRIPVYNGDFGPGAQAEPDWDEPEAFRIPVYNGDYRYDPQPEEPEEEQPPVKKPLFPKPAPRKPAPKKAPPKKQKPRKKRRGCSFGCLGMLMLPLVLVIAAAVVLSGISAPVEPTDTDRQRKPDTSTILVVGTDANGERTDTMILLYLSGTEKRVGMLSLPRDTYTITSSGNGAKLNSAYIRNGQGEEGMEGLLDYVQDILGYRPDGYVMVSMEIIPRLVDVMGGLEVKVPMSFELEGVTLKEGVHHLSGVEVLQLLRYRSGYAMQDLGRVEVQRSVIRAAMEQWIRPERIPEAYQALHLVLDNCMTDLEMTDFFWIAKTVLLGRGQIESHTLPGRADYIGDVSYYILNRQNVAALVNDRYNPFTGQITAEDLNIAG